MKAKIIRESLRVLRERRKRIKDESLIEEIDIKIQQELLELTSLQKYNPEDFI